jgi:hypothetical protein
MKKTTTAVGLLALLAMAPGCNALINVLSPNRVTVRLINNSDFSVDGELYTDDEQNIPRSLLIEFGDERTFDLAPGTMQTFSMSCDDLQAIVIADADLRVATGISPETSSSVLRDGDDFRCGDTITFTFAHSALLVDFDVFVNYERG